MQQPRIFAVVAALASLAGCNPIGMAHGREQADRATVAFHDRFNEARFDAITAEVSGEMSPAQLATLQKLLAAVHRKLGKVTASSNQGWHMNSQNLVTRVQVVQATTFEYGSGTETFAWTVTGGDARLTAYNINSLDLILK
jgi:hypothetical protein